MLGCADSRRTPRPRDTPRGSVAVLRPRQRSGRRGRRGRPGFDAICDDLAGRIGAFRAVVEGAGHEIQFTGRAINELLLATWRRAQ
jgi:hypothetical protein